MDYVIFKLIWWLFVGVLLIGFVVIDGFDMGVIVLLLFFGKIDEECCIIVNMVGVMWEGN